MRKIRISRAEIVLLRKSILQQKDELRRFEATSQCVGGDDWSIFEAALKSLKQKIAIEAGEKALYITDTMR